MKELIGLAAVLVALSVAGWTPGHSARGRRRQVEGSCRCDLIVFQPLNKENLLCYDSSMIFEAVAMVSR